MTTISNLKEHFLKLCADEEAAVQWCDVLSKALALSGELEFILTPHITSEIAYAAVTDPGIRSSANARLGTGRGATR